MYQSSTQQRASDAYKTSSYHGRSEAELMSEVMSKLIKELYKAQEAYLNRKLDVMVEHTNKTLHILDVLREELTASDAFKDPEALEPAKFLLQTYSDLITRIATVLGTPSPKDEFTALVEVITPLYRAWRAAAPTEMAPPSNVHVAESMVSVS